MRRQIVIWSAVLCLAASLQAATSTEKTAQPIHVDAHLDEPAWASATPIPVAWEWYPGDNTPAPVKTEALVAWDDRNLYVAFRAYDPQAGHIRARYAERDAGSEDDNVGFYIDPFNDDHRAYQFRVNPLGVQRDAILSDVEDTEDFSWDAIWESAGRITDDGYVVEIAVPLQQLRIPGGGGPHTWGFLAVREWPRDVTHRLRSVVTDQNRNCLVCQFGDVAGFGAVHAGRQLEVTPTLTGSVHDARSNGAFVRDDSLEPGVSGRWAMTPGTSLQATLNPDFSQVEADAAQLDVNTRFALSFEEKRPFFVEGADFFETHLPLVFTRTIADPVAGAKLTGKSGGHSWGALVARDELTNLLIPSDQSSVRTTITDESEVAIARYRREIGTRSAIGGLVTSRTGHGYSNRVISADAFRRVTERDSIRLQAAGSRTSYPDAIVAAFAQPAGSFDGHTLLASYSHSDRNWEWEAEYAEVSPDFRDDAGLVNQVGVRVAEAGIQRRVRGGPDRWYRNLYFSLGADSTREWDGAWSEWGADIAVTYQGPRQSEIRLNFAPNQEYFDGRTYHDFRLNFGGAMQLSSDVSAFVSGQAGEAIDFTNSRDADFVTVSPGADFNIGRHVRGELYYTWQRFETKQNRPIFTVHLPQARLLYHFNGRTFLRAILQVRDVRREQDQYVVPVARRSRNLLTQVLFSHRLNAQTVVLAGYSDRWDGAEAVDLTQTSRTLFVKLSYAFLF